MQNHESKGVVADVHLPLPLLNIRKEGKDESEEKKELSADSDPDNPGAGGHSPSGASSKRKFEMIADGSEAQAKAGGTEVCDEYSFSPAAGPSSSSPPPSTCAVESTIVRVESSESANMYSSSTDISRTASDSSTTARNTDTESGPVTKKVNRVMLTPEQAIEVYKRRPAVDKLNGVGGYNHGSMRGAQKVAEEYGVSIKTIRDIWTRYSWAKATMPLWTRQEMASYTRHRTSNGHLGGITPTAAYVQQQQQQHQQQQQQQQQLAIDHAAMQHGNISRSSSSGSTTGTPEFWSALTAAAGNPAASVVYPHAPPAAVQMPAGQAQMASQGSFLGINKDSGNMQGKDASGARLFPAINAGQQQLHGKKLQEMILHTQGVLSGLLHLQKVENDNMMRLLQSIHQESQIKLRQAQGQSNFQQVVSHQKEQQTPQQQQTPVAMTACTPEAAAMWLTAATAALQPRDKPLPSMTSMPPTSVQNVTALEPRRG